MYDSSKIILFQLLLPTISDGARNKFIHLLSVIDVKYFNVSVCLFGRRRRGRRKNHSLTTATLVNCNCILYRALARINFFLCIRYIVLAQYVTIQFKVDSGGQFFTQYSDSKVLLKHFAKAQCE